MSRILIKTLKQKLNKASRIALLGVGSELRGDDVVGILVAKHLKKYSLLSRTAVSFRVFLGFTAPENVTGPIRKFAPSHLIIVDAVDLGRHPGAVVLIDPNDTVFNASFSTHRLPIKVMIDYLAQSVTCKTIIIGIQPKDLTFGSSPSKEIKVVSKQISSLIKQVMEMKLLGRKYKKSA